MDWQNERYVRVYIRDTVTLTMLGWEARALLWELLRKVDRAGVLDLGGHPPVQAVAALVGIPVEVVERCLPKLTEGDDPTVVVNETALLVPNHMEAQEAVQSNAQRQRESRARRLALASDVTPRHAPSRGVTPSHAGSHPVTPRDEPSRNVTDCHVVSRGVTSSHPSLAVPSLAVPNEPTQPSQIDARARDSGASQIAMDLAHIAPRGRRPLAATGKVRAKLDELCDAQTPAAIRDVVAKLAAVIDAGKLGALRWPNLKPGEDPWDASYLFSGWWERIARQLDRVTVETDDDGVESVTISGGSGDAAQLSELGERLLAQEDEHA